MKRHKTPLRWVGGKSRALKKLEVYEPTNVAQTITEIRDAFLGGGSYPLYLSKKYPDIPVWVNDKYTPLVIFWKQLQSHPKKLVSTLLSLKKENNEVEKARALFNVSKTKIHDETLSDMDRAVAFYVLNKCSFSGLSENSSFSARASEQNFKLNLIEALPYYSGIIQKWKITNEDYTTLMAPGHTGIFLYLDPPYDIKSNIYGKKGDLHKTFDHSAFKKHTLACKCKMLVSYNVDIEGLNNYDFDLTYTMRSTKKYADAQKKRNEKAITNYPVALIGGK